jgi:AbrB family looped-hinge helix DNA binding protein
MVSTSQPGRPFRVRVADGGRIVIPVELRKELGIDEGQVVVLARDGNEIRVATIDEAIRKVQAYFAGLGPPEVIWSEEVISRRRDEAAQEANE